MEQVTIWEKITVWQRHTVGVKNVNSHQEAVNKVIECYKCGKDFWYDDDIEHLDCVYEPDTEEGITVKENGGTPTIEIEDQHGKIAWNNGKVC